MLTWRVQPDILTERYLKQALGQDVAKEVAKHVPWSLRTSYFKLQRA